MNDTSTEKNKPFHVIHTDGTFIQGFNTLGRAKERMWELNTHAQLNGRLDRYLAIVILKSNTKNTPEEEL